MKIIAAFLVLALATMFCMVLLMIIVDKLATMRMLKKAKKEKDKTDKPSI